MSTSHRSCRSKRGNSCRNERVSHDCPSIPISSLNPCIPVVVDFNYSQSKPQCTKRAPPPAVCAQRNGLSPPKYINVGGNADSPKITKLSNRPIKERDASSPRTSNRHTISESEPVSHHSSKNVKPLSKTSVPKSDGSHLSKCDPDQECICALTINDHEYLHFLLKITEDILKNDVFSSSEMEKVFDRHVTANQHRLNEDKMREQIEYLKKELNFSILQKKNAVFCSCEEGKLLDCKCCRSNKNEVCYCTNPKCPGLGFARQPEVYKTATISKSKGSSHSLGDKKSKSKSCCSIFSAKKKDLESSDKSSPKNLKASSTNQVDQCHSKENRLRGKCQEMQNKSHGNVDKMQHTLAPKQKTDEWTPKNDILSCSTKNAKGHDNSFVGKGSASKIRNVSPSSHAIHVKKTTNSTGECKSPVLTDRSSSKNQLPKASSKNNVFCHSKNDGLRSKSQDNNYRSHEKPEKLQKTVDPNKSSTKGSSSGSSKELNRSANSLGKKYFKQHNKTASSNSKSCCSIFSCNKKDAVPSARSSSKNLKQMPKSGSKNTVGQEIKCHSKDCKNKCKDLKPVKTLKRKTSSTKSNSSRSLNKNKNSGKTLDEKKTGKKIGTSSLSSSSNSKSCCSLSSCQKKDSAPKVKAGSKNVKQLPKSGSSNKFGKEKNCQTKNCKMLCKDTKGGKKAGPKLETGSSSELPNTTKKVGKPKLVDSTSKKEAIPFPNYDMHYKSHENVEAQQKTLEPKQNIVSPNREKTKETYSTRTTPETKASSSSRSSNSSGKASAHSIDSKSKKFSKKSNVPSVRSEDSKKSKRSSIQILVEICNKSNVKVTTESQGVIKSKSTETPPNSCSVIACTAELDDTKKRRNKKLRPSSILKITLSEPRLRSSESVNEPPKTVEELLSRKFQQSRSKLPTTKVTMQPNQSASRLTKSLSNISQKVSSKISIQDEVPLKSSRKDSKKQSAHRIPSQHISGSAIGTLTVPLSSLTAAKSKTETCDLESSDKCPCTINQNTCDCCIAYKHTDVSCGCLNVECPSYAKPKELWGEHGESAERLNSYNAEPNPPKSTSTIHQSVSSMSASSAAAELFMNDKLCISPGQCIDRNNDNAGHASSCSGESTIKIITLNDDIKNAKTVFYNPDKNRTCNCPISMVKKALKLQMSRHDQDEDYVLVDGPVCMPRSILEKNTIPILIENFSNMFLDSDTEIDNKRSKSFKDEMNSDVNLYSPSTAEPCRKLSKSVSDQLFLEQATITEKEILSSNNNLDEGSPMKASSLMSPNRTASVIIEESLEEIVSKRSEELVQKEPAKNLACLSQKISKGRLACMTPGISELPSHVHPCTKECTSCGKRKTEKGHPSATSQTKNVPTRSATKTIETREDIDIKPPEKYGAGPVPIPRKGLRSSKSPSSSGSSRTKGVDVYHYLLQDASTNVSETDIKPPKFVPQTVSIETKPDFIKREKSIMETVESVESPNKRSRSSMGSLQRSLDRSRDTAQRSVESYPLNTSQEMYEQNYEAVEEPGEIFKRDFGRGPGSSQESYGSYAQTYSSDDKSRSMSSSVNTEGSIMKTALAHRSNNSSVSSFEHIPEQETNVYKKPNEDEGLESRADLLAKLNEYPHLTASDMARNRVKIVQEKLRQFRKIEGGATRRFQYNKALHEDLTSYSKPQVEFATKETINRDPESFHSDSIDDRKTCCGLIAKSKRD